MKIKKMSTEQIVKYLKTQRHTAFVLWDADDVIEYAKNSSANFKLTKADAEDIIETLNFKAVPLKGINSILLDSLVYKKIDELNALIKEFMEITYDASTNQHFNSRGEMVGNRTYHGNWNSLLPVIKKIAKRKCDMHQIQEGIMMDDKDYAFNSVIKFIRKIKK